MKLDNKGFAFSTLLYGILAVIIVILMVLFGLYSKTSDEIFYYASIEEETLNKCIDQEIALENCYANVNSANASSCDKTAYYSCLGIDDNTISGKKTKIKDYLVAHPPTGFSAISGYELSHVFKGTDAKNYISFSGNTWRIIRVTSTGLVKIGLFNKNDSYKWDNANSDEWSNSTLYNYLNNQFVNSIIDNSFIYRAEFNIGRVDKDSSPNAATIYNMEKATKYASLVGLPTITDYVKASTNSTCNTNIIGTGNCASWMTSQTSWIINPLKSGANQAYVLDKDDHKIKNVNLTSNYRVVPVVYLNSNVTLVEGAGDGTSGTPFVIGK